MSSLICFHTACITCASVCLHFSLSSDQKFYLLKYRNTYNLSFSGDGKIIPKTNCWAQQKVRSMACITQKFRPDDLMGSSGFKTDEILEKERCLESQGRVPFLCWQSHLFYKLIKQHLKAWRFSSSYFHQSAVAEIPL